MMTTSYRGFPAEPIKAIQKTIRDEEDSMNLE